MAANFQQFSIMSEPSRWGHEVSVFSLENKIDQLTKIFNFLVSGRNGPARVCGICTMSDHLTDFCPTLQLGQSQEQFQNRTESHPQELDKRISRLAQTVGCLESQGKLLSQTETNPKENVSAITLRSGTIVEPPIQEQEETRKPTNPDYQEEDYATTKEGSPTPEPEQSPYVALPPFPSRFLKKDKQSEEKEILDFFSKVIFFVHGLEVQLCQSSRPQLDTLSVHAYSEEDADPIALHFVFLVHACLGRDLDR
ncbi:hypothetical protein GQ457_14G000830 [Hibiscus cannabinus]